VSKPQRDPGTIKRLQSAATNVVQTAACRPQNHLCLGTFQEASLNIIGNARLVSLVGPVVFIRFWFKKGERKSVTDALKTLYGDGTGGGSAIFPSVTRRSATCWWPPASGRMDEIETTFALTG
jgi:hypothetical protein